jgi:hypothetical protein
MSAESKKIDRVLVEVTIAAPVETVWAALREPEQIRRWFGWDADTLKDEIDFIFVNHAQASEATRTIQFDPFDPVEGVADRFELEARGASTALRVVRAGPVSDTDWENVYDDMTEGWITFVEQLRLALEKHPGAERRTIYLSGKAIAGQAPPSHALDVAGLRDAGPGRPYTAHATTGDALTGTVWHQSAFQIGLTVEQWGDGLLVVTDRPASTTAPHGGSLVLTTYGLGEEAFQALQARWSAWWSARYPSTPQPGEGSEVPAG